jgi:hypothetical protein
LPSNGSPHWSESAQQAFDTAVENAKTLAHSAAPLQQAWFALRAALALEDPELLSAAEILAGRAGTDPASQAVAALVARARSDARMENRAVAAFLAEAKRLPGRREAGAAMLAAARILDGNPSRSPELTALAAWAAVRLDELIAPACIGERLMTRVALVLGKCGAIAIRADLPSRLEIMHEAQRGDVWLWALAHDLFGDERYKARALAARLSSRPLTRALALLRRHQLTGDVRWVTDAGRVATTPSVRLPAVDAALLVAELKAPESAILPPFVFPG